jgi:hexokinase
MENVGSTPKLAHMKLDPDMLMAINCEWGAFDNEHLVLPRTTYDVKIDLDSPRPGQQAFEKMVAGLYLGEIFRLVLVDLHDNQEVRIFEGQNIERLRKPYSLDASFLSLIEEYVDPLLFPSFFHLCHVCPGRVNVNKDPYENLCETQDLCLKHLDIRTNRSELELIRRLAELVGTRAARLSACGIAAICKKKDIKSCHIAADGSVFNKCPHFKERGAAALREILD